MPITIKSSRMQYRKSNGDYVGVDAVSERKTSEYVSDIESTGSATQSAIEQTVSTAQSAIDTKAQQARDSIPSDYTALSDEVSDLKSALDLYAGNYHATFESGTRDRSTPLILTPNNNWKAALIPCEEGQQFHVKGSGGDDSRLWMFATETGTTIDSPIAEAQKRLADYETITAPESASYLIVNSRVTEEPDYVGDCIVNSFLRDDITVLDEKYNVLTKDNIVVPVLRNGSIGNKGNVNAVATRYVIPINKNYNELIFEYFGDESTADSYAMNYCLFSGATDDMTTTDAFIDPAITKYNYDATDNSDWAEKAKRVLDITAMNDYDHISFAVLKKMNGSYVPIRIANEQYSIKITYKNAEKTERDTQNEEILHLAKNARHTKRNGTPNYLTLLHFSDIHGDQTALERIIKDANYFAVTDDIICTGDMVANTYTDITPWWNENVLTCIGNHDSASYNSTDGYNWTALSMADRDAYYISPFENNWGIVHTRGTSYYYKDYADAKVRLIVMDAMLYSIYESDTTLGNVQNSWLSNLLDDAISNNLHVIIAIHSVHDGAKAVDCSFSKYNETTMPLWSDCNTPQSIIDIVTAKISSGLNFIGYIVGHTHQDNIWDAENDKTQLMYCVTCAAMSYAPQWQNSDQDRSDNKDAYNIVTIDTTNSLIKIIRGGGADVDDHMRTRKAICFNYSTGEKVGEIL